MERICYTNSGTEATLLSLRLAYAYTGKFKIAKFEGHYHGGYDQVLLSVNSPINHDAGPANNPLGVSGIERRDTYIAGQTIILPFNDLDGTTEILTQMERRIGSGHTRTNSGRFHPCGSRLYGWIAKSHCKN